RSRLGTTQAVHRRDQALLPQHFAAHARGRHAHLGAVQGPDHGGSRGARALGPVTRTPAHADASQAVLPLAPGRVRPRLLQPTPRRGAVAPHGAADLVVEVPTAVVRGSQDRAPVPHGPSAPHDVGDRQGGGLRARGARPSPSMEGAGGAGGSGMLMLASYDYLGLLGYPPVEEAAVAAVRAYGTGTGGVRMLTGTTALHHELERELAAFKGVDAALAFSSGYLANLAVIGALVGPRDRVIMDARAHRSLHDACVLARVPVHTFCHNDPAALRQELALGPAEQRTLVVVDGLYSMDGDICPLPEIIALKREFGAFLLVDEAHSFGVLGESGRGVHEHFDLPPEAVDISTG